MARAQSATPSGSIRRRAQPRYTPGNCAHCPTVRRALGAPIASIMRRSGRYSRVFKNQASLVVILDGAHEIARLGVKLDIKILDRTIQYGENAFERIGKRGCGVFKARRLQRAAAAPRFVKAARAGLRRSKRSASGITRRNTTSPSAIHNGATQPKPPLATTAVKLNRISAWARVRSKTVASSGAKASDGATPRATQTSASSAIAARIVHSTSRAFSARVAAWQREKRDAESPDKTRRGEAARQRERGDAERENQIDRVRGNLKTQQQRLKRQPFADETVERRQRGNRE